VNGGGGVVPANVLLMRNHGFCTVGKVGAIVCCRVLQGVVVGMWLLRMCDLCTSTGCAPLET